MLSIVGVAFKNSFEDFLERFLADEEIIVEQMSNLSLVECSYCKEVCRSRNISVREVDSGNKFKTLAFTKRSFWENEDLIFDLLILYFFTLGFDFRLQQIEVGEFVIFSGFLN